MERGFTLLELVVVLAILALATAMIPPFLTNGRKAVEFTAGVRDITAALHEARSVAIDTNRSEVVWINVAAGRFRVGANGVAHTLPRDVHVTLLTVADERIDDETAAIRFFPDGSSTGGQVRLTQGKRRSDVRVDWLTGQVLTRNAVATNG